jgi:hypothetical protein
LKKREALAHWRELPPNQPIVPAVVPYRQRGTTYAQDGIRLTGSQQFIDAVLSRLKELLEFESLTTRLQISYQESTDRLTEEKLGSYNCYVQVHERGREAKLANVSSRRMLSAGYGSHLLDDLCH